MNITIPKTELLETLVENRRQHIEVYELAAEAYQKALIVELKEKLALAEDGEDVSYFRFDGKPHSSSDDYDRAIAMVKMSDGETVELDSQDFSNFILDQWGWKNDFIAKLANGKLSIDEGTLSGYSNYI